MDPNRLAWRSLALWSRLGNSSRYLRGFSRTRDFARLAQLLETMMPRINLPDNSVPEDRSASASMKKEVQKALSDPRPSVPASEVFERIEKKHAHRVMISASARERDDE